MKVFYSWQSDSPDRVNRGFIREAAETAIAALAEGQTFEEAERPELDQDTKGVLGSPAIADTIFGKIQKANIMLADVTVTGQTPEGKKQINSNVAIELGYALGVHGDRVLLKVMNAYFGKPNDLPFDLRHRRHPLQYTLAPNCTKAERREAKEKLAHELQQIFLAYFNQIPTKEPEKFEATPSTDTPAIFWKDGENLVPENDYRNYPAMTMSCDQALLYLRIWPNEVIDPISAKIFREDIWQHLRPLDSHRISAFSHSRNRWGCVAYGSNRERGELLGFTQAFKNGELWGVSACTLVDGPTKDGPRVAGGKKYIPSALFEDTLRISLEGYLNIAWNCFGYPDAVNVEVGMTNCDGYHMAVGPNYVNQFLGPIYDENVVINTLVRDRNAYSRDQALLEIFNKVFDALGEERPEGFNGFVPVTS